jgi:hypothetical protein
MMGKATDEPSSTDVLTHGMPPVLDYLESIAPESVISSATRCRSPTSRW